MDKMENLMGVMENLKQPALSSIHLLAHDKDIIKYLKLKRQYVLEEDAAQKEYLLNEIKKCKNRINLKYKFGE